MRREVTECTTRQFYTKRKPNIKPINFPQFDKIIKLLTSSINNSESSIRKNKQNLVEYNQNYDIRDKLNKNIINLLKKSPTYWKNIYQAYLKLLMSNSQISLERNCIYFLDNLIDGIHQSIEDKPKDKTNRNKINNDELQLENLKLEKQNKMLRTFLGCITKNKLTPQLIHLENDQNNHQDHQFILGIQNTFENYKRISNSNNSTNIKKENIQMHTQIQQMQQTLFILKNDKITLQEKFQQLRNQHQNLCSEIVQLKYLQTTSSNSFHQTKEQMLMLNQDILSYQVQTNATKALYKELQRKYTGLLKKLNKSGKDKVDKPPQTSQLYLSTFNQQVEAFNKVKNLPHTLYKPSIDRQKNTTTYHKFLSDKQAINNLQGAKKTSKNHASYVKPTFFCLVEESLSIRGIDAINYQHFNVESIPHNVIIPTIRAIFDSKLNEILYIKNVRNITSFSSFTYSWLSNFEIDRSTRSIQTRKSIENTDIIGDFYIKIMNRSFNHNWEVVTFRQFLLDTLTNDQLYFYLISRFYLFKGDILENLDAHFSQVFYIDYSNISDLFIAFIDDQQYRKKVEQYSKKFINYIKKRALIDANFILRILLQYYRNQRKKYIQNISNIIELTKGKHNIQTVSFNNFMKIFEYHFNQLSLEDKIELYSKCYCIGNGNITTEIILTVFAEERILCLLIKNKFRYQSITKIMDPKGGQLYGIQPSVEILYSYQQYYKRYQIEYLRKYVNMIGLQSIKSSNQKLKTLNSQAIYGRYEFAIEIQMLMAKKCFYSGRIPIQKMQTIINTLSKDVKLINKAVGDRIIINNMLKWLKLVYAGKKILRFYRKKKSQMLWNFNHVVLKQDEQSQLKATQLRNQFNNLIQNVRKKYQNDNQKQV